MRLSIVVTAKNEKENISRLLGSIVEIRSDIHEFILVDAGSTDGTVDVAKAYEFPIIVDGSGTLRGGGKNAGIRKATGNIIAFLDADTKITSKWFEELKKYMEHSSIVAGYSPDPEGKHLPRVSIYVEGSDVTWPTCNIAYRKEIFHKAGLFDDKMICAEDVDFNYRCVKKGYVIEYNPKMVVYHYQRSTFIGFLKQSFWNGYGRKQLNKKHPELKHAHEHGASLKNLARLGSGLLGYIFGGILS